MKVLLAIVLFSSAVVLSYGATREISMKALSAAGKCKGEFKLEDGVVSDLIAQRNLPDSDNAKCFMACYMKEMNYLKDGKVDEAYILKTNEQKWDKPEQVETANKIYKSCMDSVGAETNDCEVAFKLASCLFTEAKKLNFPSPLFVKQ